MRRSVGLASLVSGACLFAILLSALAHTEWLRATPAQRVEVQSRPSQTTSPTPPITDSGGVVVGYTKRTTPIRAFVFGNGEKHVIVLGGIHGDEPSSVLVAEALCASFDRDPVPTAMTVVVVPRVNPDGLKVGTRTNSSGVDVNRNFPSKTWRRESRSSRYYPGEEPSSEPETRALMELIKKWSPVMLISIHAPLNCINWDGPAETIARAMSEDSGYSLRENIGYETPGSLGSYAGKDRNIPTITLEVQDAAGSEEVTRQGLLALRAALKQIK